MKKGITFGIRKTSESYISSVYTGPFLWPLRYWIKPVSPSYNESYSSLVLRLGLVMPVFSFSRTPRNILNKTE